MYESQYCQRHEIRNVPLYAGFLYKPTTPNQLLMMLIFLFLSCHRKCFRGALEPHWIQLCLVHSLFTAWWQQELSMTMPQEFGSGSVCWFWFFSWIPLTCFLFFTVFLPVSSSFILWPLYFLKHFSLKIFFFFKLHCLKSSLGTSFCPAVTGGSRWHLS